MVDQQLIRQCPLATTFDVLWTRIQTTWREIHQKHIQTLFDFMSREALIVAQGGFLHIEISQSQIMHSSENLIICVLSCT